MSDTTSSAVVNTWTWRAVGPPPPVRKPVSPKTKALIQAPLMVAVAYAIHHFTGHVIMPAIIVGLAVLILVGGLAIPSLFNAFERFGLLLARGVAAGLTWGLLVPFFYIVFGFGRLVILVTRQDPLSIKFPAPDHATFWEARPPVKNLDTYRRQH